MSAEHRFIEIVPPARATKETLYVLAVCVLSIVVAAGIVRINQKDSQLQQSLSADEISLRYDLSAAEQGVFADLQVAFDDWLLQDENEPPPSVADWIANDFPPFNDQAEAGQRGNHQWTLLHQEGQAAYWGQSQDVATAGSLLWLLPAQRQGSDMQHFEVWHHKGSPSALPHRLDGEHLRAAGWKRINRNADIARS